MERAQYLFTSEPMKVGKKEWRLVIYPANGYLGMFAFTDYEFREPAYNALPPGDWNASERWPRYNSDDSQNGLPFTLRKLHEKHTGIVAYYCRKEPREHLK